MMRNQIMPVFSVLAILFLMCMIGCGESANTDASANDRLAQTAKKYPGFESAEEALTAYYSSIDDGDTEKAKRSVLFASDEYRDQFLKYMMAPSAGMKALIKASESRFGDPVNLPPTPGQQLIEKTKTIPIETVNDHVSTWTHAEGKVVTLRKTATGWKVDLRKMQSKSRVSVFAPMGKVGEVFQILASEILEGKINSSEELKARMKETLDY